MLFGIILVDLKKFGWSFEALLVKLAKNGCQIQASQLILHKKGFRCKIAFLDPFPTLREDTFLR